jgi:hypothetical protein
MTYAFESAYPWQHHDANGQHGEGTGLTKREDFAKEIMAGLVAGYQSWAWDSNSRSPDDLANDAVTYADALIAALNKPKE